MYRYAEAAIEADPENEALMGQRTFFENQVERTQLNASFVDRLRQGPPAEFNFYFNFRIVFFFFRIRFALRVERVDFRLQNSVLRARGRDFFTTSRNVKEYPMKLSGTETVAQYLVSES